MKIINLFLLISFNFFHFFAEHQILVKGWAGIWITLRNVKYFFRLLPRSLPRSRGNVINVITGKFQFAQLYVLLCSINPHKFCETQNSTIGIVASLLAWKFLLKRIFSGKWKYKYSLKFSVLTRVFLHSGRRAYLQYLHLQYILFLDNGYCKYLHTQKVMFVKLQTISILAMTQCEMQNISCHLHHPHYDPCPVDCVIVCGPGDHP